MDNEEYVVLNDAVNKVFFDGRYEGLSVYLDLEDEAKDELAIIINEDRDDVEAFVGLVVAETLFWSDTNPYSWHLGRLMKWSLDKDGHPPPMSALLLSFSLAAERMRKGEEYSANNYYQRLCELLGINDDVRKNKIRAAGKQTLVFWKSLNRWLMDADYAYGRPTASQVNKWTYVSYALSQSLVRDADRKRFHSMFTTYGLSSHEKISESEIKLYLHEWMAGYGASEWLKKIWAVTDLRERVAIAALQELECWESDAGRPQSDMPVDVRLSWAVYVKKFPKKKISLYLVASGLDHDGVKLVPDDDARESFGGCENLWLEALLGTELSRLEPLDGLNLDAMFLSSVKLVNPDNGRKYKHDARAVIPLAKQEGSCLFREVSRMSLYGEHHVLCHRNWMGSVEHYLREHARPGYEILDGEHSPFLPSQWVLFLGVEIVVIPGQEVSNNLQCLVPLSTGLDMYMSGGLKLAPSIWHAKAPPEIFVSDEEGLLDVELREYRIDSRGDMLCSTKASSYDPRFLYKNAEVLDTNNLVVIAVRNGKPRAEKDISLRSASTPRRLVSEDASMMAYALGMEKGRGKGFTSIPVGELDKGRLCLQGMITTGPYPQYEEAVTPKITQGQGIGYDEDQEDRYYKTASVGGASESCILRGYHYWLCAPDSSSMTCRDCGRFQLAREKRGRPRKARDTTSNGSPTSSTPSVVSSRANDSVSPDIVYDAICYRGAGSWSEFQSITSVLVEEPWDHARVSRNLMDLGHIDIMLDDSLLKPKRWSCPPPALVVDVDGDAYLSGFRCDDLIDKVSKSLSSVTRAYRMVKQDMAPTAHLYELDTDAIDELQSILKGVTDPHGRPVKVVNCPAEPIVQSMPKLIDVIRFMRPVHIGDGDDVERFDPKTGKWKHASIDGRGAYRSIYAGRRYFYRSDDGDSLEGSFEIVKLLAAHDEGILLHGYDDKARSFESVIGVEPPGLHRRALVSCSGVLPEYYRGKVIYGKVPKSLASVLMFKLYA